jgi:hypothetical protein
MSDCTRYSTFYELLHCILFSVQDLKSKELTGEEIVWPVSHPTYRKSEREILILNTDVVQRGNLKPKPGWCAKGKFRSSSENSM